MGTASLVFARPSSASAALLFGDEGTAIADVLARVAVTLPGPTVAVRAARDNFSRTAIALPGFAVAAHLVWDANTDRPTVAKSDGVYQRALPGTAPHSERYQRTGLLPVGHSADYQRAWPLQAGQAGRYSATLQTPQPLASVYQRAMPHGGLLSSSYFDSALRLMASMAGVYQRAVQLALTPTEQRYQEAMRVRRDTRQEYQRAWPLVRGYGSGMGKAVPLLRALSEIYQRAWPPGPGMWGGPVVVPPVKPPCYTPNAALLFSALATQSGALLFACGGKPTPPGGHPLYTIPLLRVYMTIHTITATLLPSGEPVPLRDVTISSDDDSFGWSLSASGPERLFSQLAPVGGLPVQVLVVIDGIEWIFAVESITRSRKFAGNGATIQGRSVTALLGAPYLPDTVWGNADGDYTAQQLVAQALEYTGAAIEWGIPDWVVPQNAWSFQGSPLAVASRVAESVRAVLRSSRTENTLIFAPRYPVMRWDWGTAQADVVIPSAIITTDSLAPATKPEYNAVYVSGTNAGVMGHVRRTGSAGDLLAPQVTDALITHGDAARQRGGAILSASGAGLTQTMTLPLLTGGTNPGLVQPGYLIQVDEVGGESWRGLVRSISISASLPTVRQSIRVERGQ